MCQTERDRSNSRGRRRAEKRSSVLAYGRLRGVEIPVNKMLRVAGLFAAITLSGCMSAAQHRAAVQDDSGERVTVGTVQREIRIGMSGAEVAEALGSPNIVTTDEERREVWIYDKLATDASYSTSSGGISSLLVGIGSSIGGAAAGNASRSAGASSTSQRTLTIVIKFDNDHKVRDFAYHTSRF